MSVCTHLTTRHSAPDHLSGAWRKAGVLTVRMLRGVCCCRALDAELEAVLLSKAAQFGLPPAWVSRLDELDPERRQVLRVRSTVANSAAAQVLQSGDMLLAIDGQPLTSFADVEALVKGARWAGAGGAQPEQEAAGGSSGRRQQKAGRPAKRAKVGSSNALAAVADQLAAGEVGTATPEPGGPVEAVGAASSPSTKEEQPCAAAAGAVAAAPAPAPTITVTIFRGGQVLDLPLLLGVEDGLGTDRLVHWCGAQLQAPHRAVRELGYLPPNGGGVYISRWHHGSPAHRYGLYALHWIEEVNGVPVKDLDGFLEVVGALKDGDFARIKVCHLETQTKVGVSEGGGGMCMAHGGGWCCDLGGHQLEFVMESDVVESIALAAGLQCMPYTSKQPLTLLPSPTQHMLCLCGCASHPYTHLCLHATPGTTSLTPPPHPPPSPPPPLPLLPGPHPQAGPQVLAHLGAAPGPPHSALAAPPHQPPVLGGGSRRLKAALGGPRLTW